MTYFTQAYIDFFEGLADNNSKDWFDVNRIVAEPDEFLKLISDHQFGEVMGDKIKRIPPVYQEAHIKVPLIANKQFYYMAKLDVKDLINSDKLLEVIMEHFQLITPLNRFFKEAIS